MDEDAPTTLTRDQYKDELTRLQTQLVVIQEWVRDTGARIVVIFEGRDTAGKGGVIKRITARLNPRVCRVVALPAPTEREASQWYFQRYLSLLPAGGEIVLFDRSWYNRAGVERVMGFCTDEQYWEFMRTCPALERELVRNGILLVKYWLEVGPDEQRERFQTRIDDPIKRWKLSAIDMEAQARYVDYTEARDVMFDYTDTKDCPWYVVESEHQPTARINLICHLLTQVPFGPVELPHLELPALQKRAYVGSPLAERSLVPTRYVVT